MSSRFRAAVLLTVVVVVAAACSGSASKNSSAPTALSGSPEVRVSVAPFGTQLFPAEIIQSQGLDVKNGFRIKILNFTNPPQEYLQLTGDEADISAGTWLDLQQNEARGLKVLGVGPLLRYTNVMIVPTNSTIQSPADLKGKRIGVYFEQGADVEAVRAAMEQKYGFDFFKDSTVQQADAALLGDEMQRGDFDAIFTFSNLGSQLVASGKGRVLFSAADILSGAFGLTQDDPFGIWITSVQYSVQHPKEIRDFMTAYKEAVNILKTDDSVWPALAKTQNITDQAGIDALKQDTRASFATTWTPATINHMASIFNLMYKIGGVDLTGLDKFDTSVYPTTFWPQN